MFSRKFAVLFLVFGLLCSPILAQTSDEQAEKAKKAKELEEQVLLMLDRTIAEIGGLKLPGNRAVVYVLAGDIYWRYDSNRSRELFRIGAGELITYQAEVEKEKREVVGQPVQEFYDLGDPRFDFLNLVGQRDAELALELMGQTRPPAIAEAMARVEQQAARRPAVIGTGMDVTIINGVATSAPYAVYDPNRNRANQEIALEQQLTMRAAMGDPEKAAKAIKELLVKGVSYNVIPLLQQVLQKDEKRAADLTADVVGKITSTDYTKSNADLNGVLSILQFMARPVQPANANLKSKIFAFSAAQAQESAYQVANAFLQPSPPSFVNSSLGRAMPSIEKLAP